MSHFLDFVIVEQHVDFVMIEFRDKLLWKYSGNAQNNETHYFNNRWKLSIVLIKAFQYRTTNKLVPRNFRGFYVNLYFCGNRIRLSSKE